MAACAPANNTNREPSIVPRTADAAQLDFETEVRFLTNACLAAIEGSTGIADLQANGYIRTRPNAYEKIGNDPSFAKVLAGQIETNINVVSNVRNNSCEIDAKNIWATLDVSPHLAERRTLNASMEAARARNYDPVVVSGVLGGGREAITNGTTTVTVNSSVSSQYGTRTLSIRFRGY